MFIFCECLKHLISTNDKGLCHFASKGMFHLKDWCIFNLHVYLHCCWLYLNVTALSFKFYFVVHLTCLTLWQTIKSSNTFNCCGCCWCCCQVQNWQSQAVMLLLFCFCSTFNFQCHKGKLNFCALFSHFPVVKANSFVSDITDRCRI